ncbi:glycosyltransferase [uncultured Dokdonia sp.]|uniref:glycosyltransferase n=1 Tax=uncultured Dokdonia sp. TaxID=575653 RepID=UPI002615FE1E|nr:glycosyltransferase [uncultured Dokdonia sp.]
MRVLQLIDTLDAGGAERMAVNLANASVNHAYTGYICATRRGGILESAIHQEVLSCIAGKRSFHDLKALRKLLKFIKKNKIDIVHAHSTSIYTAFIIKLIRPKLKLVWHDHYGLSEFVKERPSQKILKIISRYMSGIIACNEDLAAWAREQLHCKEVIFLPNFVVENKDQELTTKISGVDGKRIVCLANLRPQKNHIGVLKIFKDITLQFPDWTLHVVGKDFNDDTSASIKEYIVANHLSDTVYLYDSRTDVNAILQKMDIGVLASTSEGLPLALLEYGLAGLAVMVTNVGQCAQVVQDSGVVINNVEEEGSKTLLKLMSDVPYRSKLGTDFKNRVIQSYSELSSVSLLIKFYHKISV